MISQYSCPICSADDWVPVQTFRYAVSDSSEHFLIQNNRLINLVHLLTGFARSLVYASPRPKQVRQRLLNAYERLRREVLFKVWFAGNTNISITSQYCKNCGFMAYTPRPDETDIEHKYHYLGQYAKADEIEKYNAFLDADPYSQRNRKQIHDLIMKEQGNTCGRVLDCGGSSGWFVTPFAESGCRCELVDYETEQLPGIVKVGNSIHELQDQDQYDAIVCRAVLEHLADPLRVVKKFNHLLKENGVVYALVPGEVHAGTDRLGYDPVTHINFFTPYSFATLFRMASFEVIDAGTDEVNNIWVLAKKTGNDATESMGIPSDIDTYLYPSRSVTMRALIRRLTQRFR